MTPDLDPEAAKTVARIGQAIAMANNTHDVLRPKEEGEDIDDERIQRALAIASRPSGAVSHGCEALQVDTLHVGSSPKLPRLPSFVPGHVDSRPVSGREARTPKPDATCRLTFSPVVVPKSTTPRTVQYRLRTDVKSPSHSSARWGGEDTSVVGSALGPQASFYSTTTFVSQGSLASASGTSVRSGKSRRKRRKPKPAHAGFVEDSLNSGVDLVKSLLAASSVLE
jgi:hypothetical protein